jgi:hypothetical protein
VGLDVYRGGALQEQDLIAGAAILDKWSEDPWANGVQTDEMEDMETLAVRTRNNLYEITIIEGKSGEVLVRGGQFFPELTPARLAGATMGGCFCKMRGIYVGFRMEINENGRRTVTSPVLSIASLAWQEG